MDRVEGHPYVSNVKGGVSHLSRRFRRRSAAGQESGDWNSVCVQDLAFAL